MPHGIDVNVGEDGLSTLLGVIANTYDSLDSHDVNNGFQMSVTCSQNWFNGRFWKINRRHISSSLTKDEEWAMVDNKNVRKNDLSRTVVVG